jgi:uncharacterized protein involved in oxidation of intracellular sulfur
MKYLLILNDAPYGNERSYNELRLALSLAKTADSEIRLFLMADAAACGKSGQTTPQGYHNLEGMLKSLVNRAVPIGVCGSCMDARGTSETDLIAGVHRSYMEELTDWAIWADKAIVS